MFAQLRCCITGSQQCIAGNILHNLARELTQVSEGLATFPFTHPSRLYSVNCGGICYVMSGGGACALSVPGPWLRHLQGTRASCILYSHCWCELVCSPFWDQLGFRLWWLWRSLYFGTILPLCRITVNSPLPPWRCPPVERDRANTVAHKLIIIIITPHMEWKMNENEWGDLECL